MTEQKICLFNQFTFVLLLETKDFTIYKSIQNLCFNNWADPSDASSTSLESACARLNLLNMMKKHTPICIISIKPQTQQS